MKISNTFFFQTKIEILTCANCSLRLRRSCPSSLTSSFSSSVSALTWLICFLIAFNLKIQKISHFGLNLDILKIIRRIRQLWDNWTIFWQNLTISNKIREIREILIFLPVFLMVDSGFTFLLQWQQFVQFTFVFCVKFFKILKIDFKKISFENWIEFLNLPHIHWTNPSNPWDIVPNRNLILRPCCQRLQDSWRVQSSSGKFSFFAICFDFVSTSADLLTSFWSVAERERWEKIRKSWKWKCQQRQKKLLSSETGKTGIVKVNLWIRIFYIFDLFYVFFYILNLRGCINFFTKLLRF